MNPTLTAKQVRRVLERLRRRKMRIAYKPDSGPVSDAQLDAIKKIEPQGRMKASRGS